MRPLLSFVLLFGCGGDDDAVNTVDFGQSSGAVVAEVGELTITSADLEAEMARGGAEGALERLIDDALWTREALKRGYHAGRGAEMNEAESRALVRELLHLEIDSRIRRSGAPLRELRAMYEAEILRYQLPERRFVVHFLAEADEEASPAEVRAARELAQNALEVTRQAEPEVAFAQLRESVEPGVSRVEDLEEVSEGASFVEPFLSAALGPQEPQVVDEIVRTSFGFHVIWVRAITEPVNVSFEEAQAELAKVWEVETRRTALASLEERLVQEAFNTSLRGVLSAEVTARLQALPLNFEGQDEVP